MTITIRPSPAAATIASRRLRNVVRIRVRRRNSWTMLAQWRGQLQVVGVAALLRGAGAPAAKSLALLSVSWQPASARETDVVFEGAEVRAVSKQFAVDP